MSKIIDIGTNFKNVRSSLTVMAVIDIGTHMSFIKLSTGNYIVIDTCPLTESDKVIVDKLTNNGKKIECVIGTHPFHTLYFTLFYTWYPNCKYYGTPRHLRVLPDIPWTDNILTNLSMYENEGIYMKIPAGADIDPVTENHFSCVFVYHTESKTLHVDDTLMCYDNPGCVLRTFGCKNGQVSFWLGGLKMGLQKTKEAPYEFKNYMETILLEWDIDNLVTAHTGNKIGNAKESIRTLVNDTIPKIEKLSKQYS